MIDLRGIARRFRLPAEQLRVAADLLEQGYQPGFIERYRADESGQLPNDVLWALKLEIDLQKRLEGVREKVKEQLPKDAELDQEAIDSLARATTEVEIDAALRCYRARRNLVQSQERTGQAGTLLEKLIAYEGPAISDLPQWVATELQVEATEAEQVVEQTKRLIGALVQCDTMLNEKLRRSVQRKAQIRVEFIDQDKKDVETETAAKKTADDAAAKTPNEAKSGDAETSTATQVEAESSSESDASTTAATETAETGTPDGGTEPTTPAADASPKEATAEVKSEEETPAAAPTPASEPVTAAETPADQSNANEAGTTSEVVADEATTGDAIPAEATNNDATTSAADDSKKHAEAPKGAAEFAEFKGKKAAKQKAAKDDAAKKAPAKMTPRQRRRRWLIAMLQPMKSLKKPATKLTAYQQLMLGRGRRSQLVKTPLNYDKRPLFQLARDSFVADKHPLSAWFEGVVAETLENAWLAKVENDALADLEELAQEKLLENAADQLRANLSQRPIRGHVIMVVDTVGPKAASVAVVGPTGKVLATDEVSCSAHPSTIDQNVVRLGEMAHKFKVTLVTLTNGPARRFLILTVRELMKQSASSGLRWTMADRGGAEAYAAGRIALRELSAHNRRDRAAIWIGRSLQDPLSQLLKVEQGRLRLGSYQRELPQEPLKKLVRETIADCVCSRGLDAHHASAEDLQYVPGIAAEQALQISKLASSQTLASRQQLLQAVTDWPEKQARQAIALLRVFESEEPLDGTAIHPDDYKLATRLIDNTELSAPPSAPEAWKKPEPESEVQEQKVEPASAAETSTTDAAEASEPVAESPAADEAKPEEAAPEVAAEVAEATEAAPAAESSASEAEPAVEAVNTVEATEAAAPTEATAEADGATAEEASAAESTSEEAGAGNKAAAATSEAPVDPETTGIKPEYSEDVVVAAKAGPPIDVEKLARGWQVGREKLKWVANCLNDPFADTRLAGSPVPMLSVMPTLETLEPGMCLWAVVVGVADFGAFVEIAPDCSGLIHISRLSADYVEDPHQVVQVGDLLMTWVVSIDEKKNRVALTALSPAQVAANAAARREEREANARSSGGGGGNRGGQGGNRSQGGQRSSGGGRTQDNRDGGKGGRGGPGQGGGRGGKPRGDHGGRGRGGQGGARRGGPSKPVIVKSKKPKAPISSAMKEGDEPLRSFSDLMQFYEAKRTDVPAPKVVEKASSEASAPVAAEVAAPEATAPEASAPEKAGTDTVAVDSSASASESPAGSSDTASDLGSQDGKVEN